MTSIKDRNIKEVWSGTYGKAKTKVHLFPREMWENTVFWQRNKDNLGSYRYNNFTIYALGDYPNAHLRLNYNDDHWRAVVKHEYIHSLQHLVGLSKGLHETDFPLSPLGLNVSISDSIKKHYKESEWILEAEACWLAEREDEIYRWEDILDERFGNLSSIWERYE
jgi:hypothetical protein